jgi:hypothetical protein
MRQPLHDRPRHPCPPHEVPHVHERPIRPGLEHRPNLVLRDPMHVLQRQPDPIGHRDAFGGSARRVARYLGAGALPGALRSIASTCASLRAAPAPAQSPGCRTGPDTRSVTGRVSLRTREQVRMSGGTRGRRVRSARPSSRLRPPVRLSGGRPGRTGIGFGVRWSGGGRGREGPAEQLVRTAITGFVRTRHCKLRERVGARPRTSPRPACGPDAPTATWGREDPGDTLATKP